MIYLDYSATTPVNSEVLDSFVKCSKQFVGNANSIHKLGLESKKLMEKSVEQVANILKVKKEEVIFTSSASEANNMVLKGVLEKYKTRGKHIITTKLEHSSILDTCSYLENIGYEVSYINVGEDGIIDLSELEKLIRDDTVLVSIHHVNSEVGIKQDINKIGKFLKDNYPKVFFHVDGTQSIGKIPVSLDNVDLFTFSAHKFYGLKGVACLIKKQNVGIVPLIHGGKSQSEVRSGTPSVALYVSLAKALRLATENLEVKYNYVLELNKFLKDELVKIEEVSINSNDSSIPHIVNISIKGIKPEVMLHALEQEEIYVSTKTACSKDSSASISLLALGYDNERSSSSIRISLSHLTTKDELEEFIKILKIKIEELNLRKDR